MPRILLHHRTRVVAFATAVVCAVGCAGEKQNRLASLNGRDPLMGEKIPPPNVPTGRDRYGMKDARDPILRADATRNVDSGVSELRIADDRRPAGGLASRGTTGTTVDQMTKDLERSGVRVFSPTRTETGGYEVRAQVPTGPTGAMSGYVGGGTTPAAALRDVYDQVRADRR